MENLIQAELDMVEEHLLTCLFGNATLPQVNPNIRTGLALVGQNPITIINKSIVSFETMARPFLKENGYVDGNKLSQLIEAKFNKQVPIGDFRMIDVTRRIEPWLKTLGSYMR